MTVLRAALVLAVWIACASPARAVDTCVDCHAAQSAASLSRQCTQVATDIHGRAGLSCHHCHGGDPAVGMDDPYESMDEKKGYVGIPKVADVAAMCTRCHADAAFMRAHAPTLPVDQGLKFAASRHAAGVARNEKGAATCTACHRAHGVLPASDPRSPVHPARVPQTCGRCHSDPSAMGPKNLACDVVAEYTASVHWRAVRARIDRTAPVCHDCHGNHAAATPEPAAVTNLCGRCHTAERETFARGRHVKAPGFRGCAECHANHRVEPVSEALLAPTGVCYRCHREPGRAQDEARNAHAAYSGLAADIDRATAELEPLKRHALPLGTGEEALAAAREKLITARRLIHTDDLAQIDDLVKQGAAGVRLAREAAARAAGTLDHRRRGAFAFALLALFTSLTLAAKVRQLWRHEPGGEELARASSDHGN